MKNHSIVREEEYRKLGELSVDGSILDLGGNSKSEYQSVLKGNHSFTSANIDPSYGCDLIFDIQKPFPIDTGKFDAIISMNVFEHIYGFQNAFSESARVLKKDGILIFAVPFMHHIHGCPDDYFRYTGSAFEKVLALNGFGEIKVQNIGAGLFSFIYQTCSGALPSFLKPVFREPSIALDRFLSKISKRYRAVAERIPLGYFVTARK